VIINESAVSTDMRDTSYRTPRDGDTERADQIGRWLVLASMLLIAAAVGAGLYVQAGLAIWVAALGAVVAFAALLAVRQALASAPRPVPPEPRASHVDARSTPAQRAPAPDHKSAPMPADPYERSTPALHSRPLDPDDSFRPLQSLVRHLAAETEGPKAATPDPDRAPPAAAIPDPSPLPPFRPEDLVAAPPVARAPRVEPDPSQMRVAEAVAAERLDVLLQPIQTLADRKATYFEVSVRFRDAAGEPLDGADVSRVARASGLAGTIDALKLVRVARVAHHVLSRGRSADIVTGLDGLSLADQAFLETFANAIAPGDHHRMVLAFAQSDVRAFGRFHWETLATMADLGLRFALQDVTDLDMDFEALKVCSFAMIKLDAPVFLEGLPAAGGFISPDDLARYFGSLGFDLVVARVDNGALLDEIARRGVRLGQGQVFGAAKVVRQDLLTAARAA
jgi:cyclic-di-GMP phosphodiesterase TipF (flagellum assembly factor)